MDNEIDLGQYIQALVRHWRLIAALTLVGGLIAAGVSLALPNVYESVALVSVTTARNTLQLSGVNQDTTLPAHAYPELAMSSDVVSATFAEAGPLLPASVNTLDKFAGQLTAEAASDPTLLRLRVRDRDPQRAAQIADLWAQVFSAHSGQLYTQDQTSLTVYQQQLDASKTRLDQADTNLATFQSSNQVNILTAQLDSQQASLTDYLNRQHQLQLVSQDAQSLLDRLNGLPATGPASPANDLALVSIMSRIYGEQTSPTNTVQSQSAVPIQLQLSTSQPLAGPTVADQKSLAQNLQSAITARLADISQQLATLQPQILAQQGQLAQAQVKAEDLSRAQKLAEDEYTQLAQQVAQANLALLATSDTIQVASQASIPGAPVSPRRTLYTALGLAVGLVLGALLALALELLRPAPVSAGRAPALSDERGSPAPAP